MPILIRLDPAAPLSAVGDPLLFAALGAGVPVADVPPAVIDRLHGAALLRWSVPGLAEARPLMRSLPVPVIASRDAAPGRATVPLSRFALLRREHGEREHGEYVLESGRSRWQVRLTAAGLAALGDLRAAGDDAGLLLGLLGACGLLDDDDASAAAWQPHDRYFASRSRTDLGPALRLPAEWRDPGPALRPEEDPTAVRIPLPRPTGPEPDEPTLWQAAESRRSVRTFADEPVPLPALGALLWRTLRVIEERQAGADAEGSYAALRRPVGSGGGMHGTDLWLWCGRVADVPVGIWRYDPRAHALVGVAAGDPGDVLARFAGTGAPVVGLLTVRHSRAGAKYDRIAFALELKDVGVILHALQLTAGALGLGMCPWGSGPTEAVARLLGTDPEVDAPIGEFVLGVPADSSPD